MAGQEDNPRAQDKTSSDLYDRTGARIAHAERKHSLDEVLLDAMQNARRDPRQAAFLVENPDYIEQLHPGRKLAEINLRPLYFEIALGYIHQARAREGVEFRISDEEQDMLLVQAARYKRMSGYFDESPEGLAPQDRSSDQG